MWGYFYESIKVNTKNFHSAECNVAARKSLLTSRASIQITKRLSSPSPLLLIVSWMYSTPRALVTRCNIGNNNFSESLSRSDNDRWTMQRGQCAKDPRNGVTGCSYIMYCATSRTRMQREPYRINTIVCCRVLIDSGSSSLSYARWSNLKFIPSKLSYVKYVKDTLYKVCNIEFLFKNLYMYIKLKL